MPYVDRDNNAVYALNSYVWKLLEANLGFNTADYEGAKPIVSNQQQPELLQSGKPFIVYGSAIQPPMHLYVCNNASVAYMVYAVNPDEVNAITNLMSRTFERQDEAAADVNRHLALEAPHRANGKRNVEFQSIKTSMVETAEGADEEGGYHSALVLVDIKYILTDDTIQTTGFTYP